MGTLTKSLCFTAALSSDFSLQHMPTRSVVSFHAKEMPLLFAKARHWNVIAQRWSLSRKLVRPSCVMRRAQKSNAPGKRKRLHHHRTCTYFIARARPEIFLILSFRTTHTILRIMPNDESGMFDFNTGRASFTFVWHGADRYRAFSRSAAY